MAGTEGDEVGGDRHEEGGHTSYQLRWECGLEFHLVEARGDDREEKDESRRWEAKGDEGREGENLEDELALEHGDTCVLVMASRHAGGGGVGYCGDEGGDHRAWLWGVDKPILSLLHQILVILGEDLRGSLAMWVVKREEAGCLHGFLDILGNLEGQDTDIISSTKFKRKQNLMNMKISAGEIF